MQQRILFPLLALVAACIFSGCTPPPGPSNPTNTVPSSGNMTGAAAPVAPKVEKTYYVSAPAAVAATALISAPAADGDADPLDWTYCRGPNFDGTSVETGLIDDWDPEEGTNVLWSNPEFGGRSTPIVMNGRVYCLLRSKQESSEEGERVVCLDAATGKMIWQNEFNVYLSDVPDTRVGWSSVTGDPATGRVYALGVCGLFQCLDGETGKQIWSIPMHERFGLLSTYGGRTNFPVICDDLVIVSSIVIGWGNMAKPAHRFVGFDKATGEVVWFNGTRPLPYDTTYSPPILTNIDGQKLFVFGSGDGAVWAIQPRTGKHVWQYQFSKRGLNVGPIASNGIVYTGHSEENIGSTSMGSIVAIDATKAGNLTATGAKWRVDELMVGKASPLVIGDRVYCFDDRAKLHILDIKTGEPVIRKRALGTVMRAGALYADGKIYTCTANGRWYIMKPDEKSGVEIISKGRLPAGSECHSNPVVSHGRIYWQTTGGLYCLQDKSKESGAGEAVEHPAESDVADDQTPAQLQLVPAELLMKPGESAKLTARLFNARGQFLKEAEAEISVDGAGSIADYITAKVGELTGSARVRVVPPLPWSFDFDDLDNLPVTWVGARYRHILRPDDDGKHVVKITTIPKGTRSRCWFGHSDLNNYTIEADVKGAITNNQMPDIGLIGQGYAFVLGGASQEVQIRSWVTQLRMAKSTEFKWKPNVWYRMKFQTSIDGDKAVLRGKIWEKDSDEPAAWTIEAVDTSPNRSGSPGLFGSAKVAELYLDNIKVYSNDEG
jgi:outer membrane protein assembly factor BamB